MVAVRITPEHAVDSVCELLRSWFDVLDVTLEDEDLPTDLVDLATALDTSDAREALRRVDAVFSTQYGEAILGTRSDELGIGRVAAWRLVKAAIG